MVLKLTVDGENGQPGELALRIVFHSLTEKNKWSQKQEGKGEGIRKKFNLFTLYPFINVRFCTNPLPAFGGAKCVKNDKFKWLSHENAELDTAACKSPLDSSGPEGSYDEGITPWCPENCVLTEWAQWSACSATCIPSSVILIEILLLS